MQEEERLKQEKIESAHLISTFKNKNMDKGIKRKNKINNMKIVDKSSTQKK